MKWLRALIERRRERKRLERERREAFQRTLEEIHQLPTRPDR